MWPIGDNLVTVMKSLQAVICSPVNCIVVIPNFRRLIPIQPLFSKVFDEFNCGLFLVRHSLDYDLHSFFNVFKVNQRQCNKTINPKTKIPVVKIFMFESKMINSSQNTLAEMKPTTYFEIK